MQTLALKTNSDLKRPLEDFEIDFASTNLKEPKTDREEKGKADSKTDTSCYYLLCNT